MISLLSTNRRLLWAGVSCCWLAAVAAAQQPNPNPVRGNPIVETLRAADPDVHVWDGTVWMYTSQDQPPGPGEEGYANMDGYHAFSSTDMVNWTDHGEILHSDNVSWGIAGGGWMWAPGAARKGNAYYLYYPHKAQDESWRIGVATASTPQGPFTDTGSALRGAGGTDPMVFTDDDGQSYMYFGDKKVARLSDNMLSLAETARTIDYGASNFGEGAWMFKRNGTYYYTWTDFQDPVNQGYYATGNNPYGPFNYQGPVGPRPNGAQDHHSIVEYQDQWYYFYHVGNFTNASGEPGAGNRRNAAVEYLYFNPDGTMKLVQHTATGVGPIIPPPPQGPRGITINIDFGSGPLQTGSAAAPAAGGVWNRVTTANAAGTSPLVDSTGVVTPVRLAFDALSQFSNNNTAAEIGSNGQFKSLMQDYLYTSTPKNFTLSGLDPNRSYDLYLYGQGDGVGQDGLFSFSDQLANTSYDSPSNNGLLSAGVEYVVFRGRSSNANGQLAFTFAGWGGVGGFNGFQLVEFAPLLPGDYNADGRVDTADYTAWRDKLGAPAGTLPNDVDGGPIGQPQYQTWRTNYGTIAGSALFTESAIPEPSSLLLIVSGAFFACQLMAPRCRYGLWPAHRASPGIARWL